MFKGNIAEMMKQAQKMQQKMQENQAQLAQQETTGNAGAGLVSITLNGKYQAKQVKIDDSILDDKDMLEDLVAAAINDTVKKISEDNKKQMKDVTASMGLPADFKLPF